MAQQQVQISSYIKQIEEQATKAREMLQQASESEFKYLIPLTMK